MKRSVISLSRDSLTRFISPNFNARQVTPKAVAAKNDRKVYQISSVFVPHDASENGKDSLLKQQYFQSHHTYLVFSITHLYLHYMQLYNVYIYSSSLSLTHNYYILSTEHSYIYLLHLNHSLLCIRITLSLTSLSIFLLHISYIHPLLYNYYIIFSTTNYHYRIHLSNHTPVPAKRLCVAGCRLDVYHH